MNRLLRQSQKVSLSPLLLELSGDRGEQACISAFRVSEAGLGLRVRVSLLRPELEAMPPRGESFGFEPLSEEQGRVCLGLAPLEVLVNLEPMHLEVRLGGSFLLGDHPFLAYSEHQGRLRHTLIRPEGERYYGLGEVSGPLPRNGRRYRLEPKDALGYDAEQTDPLYKHWPVYLTRTAQGHWYALIYDLPFAMTFDLGQEIHAYHGPYRYTEAEGEAFGYDFLWAPSLSGLVEAVSAYVGRPQMPPRWSLGYLASGMAYADAVAPEEALTAFARRCRKEGVPVSAMHLSSGYTLREGRRYVFRWSERIADPGGVVKRLKAHGLRLIANVKPALLMDHPDYPELDRQGLFLRDREGHSYRGMFWGGEASWLDFTRSEARRWWQKRLQETLLDLGVEGIWNDNNEYALEEAFTAEGKPVSAAEQIKQMSEASYRALVEHDPNRRPFLVSRSASLGVQHLAQTWSGDNTSSWQALRYNVPMGLSLSLCGFSNTGHDVGGFYGEAPGPELFLRWVQQGIFYPRFSIHSWKTPPTEPWSYPEVFPYVKEAIRLRYRLLPYLYSLFWAHTTNGAPIMRPLFYEFADKEALEDSFSFLLGPYLLLPGEAFTPGVLEAELWLAGEGWYDLEGARFYPGGRHRVHFPLEKPPVLVRAGALLPLSGTASEASREVWAYPSPGSGRSEFWLYEDDGESLDYHQGAYSLIRLGLESTREEVRLEAETLHLGYPLSYREISFRLPPGEGRRVRFSHGLVETRREGTLLYARLEAP